MYTEDGGVTDTEKNMYLEAVKFYENELASINQEDSQDTDLCHKKAEILVALAETTQTLGDWNRALDYFNEAIGLNEFITDPEARVTLYWKAGNIYAERNEWESAMSNYNIALELSRKFEDTGIAEIYRGIGRV